MYLIFGFFALVALACLQGIYFKVKMEKMEASEISLRKEIENMKISEGKMKERIDNLEAS